jgi:hypothetical protein
MMWVINVARHPLLSCKLALRGNISLGHVTNCKTIIFGTVMDDVTLISAWFWVNLIANLFLQIANSMAYSLLTLFKTSNLTSLIFQGF